MDTDNPMPMLIGFIVILIILSAYFSASETAFSSLNKIRLKNIADKGSKNAKLAVKLHENYDGILSTILLGNNIVNIATASIATTIFVSIIGAANGPGISTLITTIVVLIFGEITPKTIAKRFPEKFAMFSAPILNLLYYIFYPINFLFGLLKKILSLFFKETNEADITEEEIIAIIDEATRTDVLDEQENGLIKSTLDFTEREASNILTPRMDIAAISINATKDDAAAVFNDTYYSRLPVYEESIDHIVGIIYQKDFFAKVYYNGQEIRDIIRPAIFVPENKKIGTLLKELQAQKTHIAIVLDSYGGTAGIITMEDILEELVDEIYDEYDEVETDIEKCSNDEYIISGTADLDDIFDELNIYIDDKPQGIVNGWAMSILDKAPEENDTFEFSGYTFTVKQMDGNRIEKMVIKKSAD